MALPAGLTPIDTNTPTGLSELSSVPAGLTPAEKPDVVSDVATQLPTGVARAYKEFGDTLGAVVAPIAEWFMGNDVRNNHPDLAKEISQNIWRAVPFVGEQAAQKMENLPKPETTAGAIAGGLTQASTGFLISKPLPSSLIKNKTLQMMMAGALTDFSFFDPYEKRLSNLAAESDTIFNNTLTQYLASNEDDPELEARMKQMLEGGILGVTADRVMAGIRWSKGILQAKADIKNAGKLFAKLQPRLSELRYQGMSPEEAFSRTLREAGISKDQAFDAALKSGQEFKFNTIIPTEKEVSQQVQQATKTLIKNKIFNAGKTALDKTDIALGALRTRIQNISPELGFKLQRFEYDSAQMSHKALEQTQPFLKGLTKLRSTQRDIYNNISLKLANQDYEGVSQLISSVKNTKLRGMLDTEFKSTRTLMRSFYDMGRAVNPELGFLDDYFPRAVKDYKGLAAKMGFSSSDLERALAKQAAKKGAALTETEITQEINKFLRGLSVPKRGIARPDGTKVRVIQYLKPDDIVFYKRPEEALTEYIHHMSHYINKRKFFGYAGDNLDESVGHLLGQMRTEGKLTSEQIDNLSSMLTARFGGGERAASKTLQNLKNGFYAVTLNDPLNALQQVGDIAIAAHRHGIVRTLKTTVKQLAAGLTKDPGIKVRDIGLDRISEEFASTTGTAKYLNRLFRMTGFKKIDELGKEVHINAAFNKFNKWMQTEKGINKFVQKYGPAFDDTSLQNVIQDFKAGRVTNDTKFVVFNELADVQPVTLSEMPQWYLEHPGGRLLYTLRSFTLKQFDVLRRDAYNEIKKGNIAKGTKNLLSYATLFTIAGAGVDQTKAWILGRDLDPEQNFTNNMLKMIGLSTYIVDKAKTEKASATISSVLLPPIGATTDPIVSDLQHWSGISESLKVLPFGKLLYNFFGGGAEKAAKWERKRQRQELRERLKID